MCGVDVEPFPRMKLMKILYLCLEAGKSLPDACSEEEVLNI